MQISKRTRDIIKNFSLIDGSLMLSSGILRQKSPGNDMRVFAFAKIEEEFPNFFVYNVSNFLGVLNAFGEKAELNFGENMVTITSEDGKRKVDYYASNPQLENEVLRKLREKGAMTMDIINSEHMKTIDFTISATDIADILKLTSHISNNETFSLYADGQNLNLSLGRKVDDGNNESKNVYDSVLMATKEQFRFDIDINALKLLDGDYNASLAIIPPIKQENEQMSSPVANFMLSTGDEAMKYWLSVDTTSVFPNFS